MQEVTLAQMLDAREARVHTQSRLLAAHPDAALIAFTLNIPGPVKTGPAILRAFRHGCGLLEDLLKPYTIYHKEHHDLPTGPEGYYAVQADAREIKTLCLSLEDGFPMGRLFDLDVLTPDGSKIERGALGYAERGCMVCSAPGRGCASRRLHTVDELQAAAFGLIENHFCTSDADRIGVLASAALIDEVEATPKPGLVDRSNAGSHTDMDIGTFRRSAASLQNYFTACVSIGMDTQACAPETVFPQLRAAGLEAEKSMFAATNGINTHKGAIYTLGVLCGAVGRLWSAGQPMADTDRLLDTCADLTRIAVRDDFAAIRAKAAPQTAGERLYLQYGLRGIRGEVADGLPALRQYGLPAFHHVLSAGRSAEEAGLYALLQLIAHTDDTTLWHRGGKEGADHAQQAALELLDKGGFPSTDDLLALDRDFIAQRLSPGGCADLLAVLYFLYRLKIYFKV